MKKLLFFNYFIIFIAIFTLFYVFFCNFSKNLIVYAYENKNINIELKYNNEKYIFNNKKLNQNPHTYLEKYHKENSYFSLSKDKQIEHINNCVKLGFGYEYAFESIYPKLRPEIDKLERKYFVQVKNASFKFTPFESAPFKIENSVEGRVLNREKLFKNICAKYAKSNNISLDLPFEKISPKFTTEQAKNLTALRSTFSTNYSASTPDRKSNIRTALGKFNGLVVEDGEHVSFNNVVGKRTIENGYKTAKIIMDGEYVDGLGGGVCQASTTLYNALVLANVKIDRVQRHSRRVGYVPPALDAMVNWGSSDMVFTNTTGQPLYITTHCTDTKAGVNIYGLSHGQGVSYATESEIVSTSPPPAEELIVDYEGKYKNKVYYEDESFYLHRAKDGIVANSYLVKRVNGNLVWKKLLRTEKYPAERATRVVGANKRVVEDEYDWLEMLKNLFA